MSRQKGQLYVKAKRPVVCQGKKVSCMSRQKGQLYVKIKGQVICQGKTTCSVLRKCKQLKGASCVLRENELGVCQSKLNGISRAFCLDKSHPMCGEVREADMCPTNIDWLYDAVLNETYYPSYNK